MNDFNGGIRSNPYKALSEKDKAYLLEKHETKTTAEMAKFLSVSGYKVQCWLKELGIEKKRVVKSRVHALQERTYNFSDSNGNFVWDKNCVTI